MSFPAWNFQLDNPPRATNLPRALPRSTLLAIMPTPTRSRLRRPALWVAALLPLIAAASVFLTSFAAESRPEATPRAVSPRGPLAADELNLGHILVAVPEGAKPGEVASRLAMSSRSLQRKLGDEGTSFKNLLHETREAMARRYVADPRLSYAEIAFLLGFEDPNSFFRAFNAWTGTTPEAMRREGVSAGVQGRG